MQQIDLLAVPNQKFNIRLDNDFYEIVIRYSNNIMTATITRNGVTVIAGVRLVPKSPILPFKYLEEGNFVLLTQNDDYPNYMQFNVTQFLWFVTKAELEAIRAGS